MRLVTISLLIILVLNSTVAQSQRRLKDRHFITFGLGATGFMGDLGGADNTGTQGLRDFNFNAVRPTLMAGYLYRIYPFLSINGNLSVGYVYGNDNLTNETFRNNRNIHFRSPLIELSSTGHFTFFDTQRQGAQYRRITRTSFRYFGASAYIFAGVSAFYFNPQAYFDASAYTGTIDPTEIPSSGWYNLRPLRTEGQEYFDTRRNYVPIGFAIPFGIGAKMQISNDISIGLQYGFRKTFTDYIDDVSKTYVDPSIYPDMFDNPGKIALAEYFSNPTNNQLPKSVTAPGQQRGNPYNTDAYMFALITVHYKISFVRRPYGLIRF